MAEQNKSMPKEDHERLEQVALGIFSACLASGVHQSQMALAARRSFQGAAAFLELSNKIANGQPINEEVKKGPQLANCNAPNLPKTHPFNLVAQKHQRRDGTTAGGDLKRVAQIWDRIKGIDLSSPEIANVPMEQQVLDLPEYGIQWSRQDLSTAKQIFPSFVEAAASN